MKKISFFLLLTILISKLDIAYSNTMTQDISYTVGYSIGNNILVQFEDNNISLNSIDTIEGFVDGIKEKRPKISIERMDEAINSLQEKSKLK